jgi:hypothetical protein
VSELALKVFDGLFAQAKIDDTLLALTDIGGFDWAETTYDSYDDSIELKGATPEARLNPLQIDFLRKCGFAQCWLCHTDRWETYYNFSTSEPTRTHRPLPPPPEVK